MLLKQKDEDDFELPQTGLDVENGGSFDLTLEQQIDLLSDILIDHLLNEQQ